MKFAPSAINMISAKRRQAEFSLFGNTVPLRTNLLYAAHHTLARAKYAAQASRTDGQRFVERSTRFARDGYMAFPPPQPEAQMSDLARRVDAALEDPELTHATHQAKGLVTMKDALKVFPEVVECFTDEVVGTIEAFYGSHFKIFNASMYRIFPIEQPPDVSFLWHFDNTPDVMIKLMVYLDPSSKETGAFRLKPRPISLDMKRRGYWDRRSGQRFISELQDERTTQVFEGGVGTSILFKANTCLHKATHPEVGHRDVIVFFIHPSLVPWKEHLEQNRPLVGSGYDSCANPFTDAPRVVS